MSTHPDNFEIDLGDEAQAAPLTENEEVLADAEDLTEDPPQKPEGSPHFVSPAVALGSRNRELRAQFFRLIQPVNQLESLDESDPEATAIAMDAMAGVEKAMRLVVLPAARPAYEKWVKSVDDETLMQLFAWYMAEYQPGEASPSQG